MNYLQSFIGSFECEAIFKLILGALLTGLIGLERSRDNKPAGFGTHAILGVSAVLVMLSSEFLHMEFNMDIARLPAQLLSGIGFIGAGTILRDGLNVKGVTTASGILAVTCIGLAVGAGFYIGAVSATLIVYFLLSKSHDITKRFEQNRDIE